MPLTLEDKFEAILAIGPAHITLESRFVWIVVQEDVYRIHADGEGEPLMGRDTTPYGAIHRHFDLLTLDRVVLYTRHPTSRLVRWNSGRWTSVPARDHFTTERNDAGRQQDDDDR